MAIAREEASEVVDDATKTEAEYDLSPTLSRKLPVSTRELFEEVFSQKCDDRNVITTNLYTKWTTKTMKNVTAPISDVTVVKTTK